MAYLDGFDSSKLKIIAFDLDGTLLDDEKGLPEENLSAMLAASFACTPYIFTFGLSFLTA